MKLDKEYRIIGRIPMAAVKKIQEVMTLPGNIQIIRANTANTLKHNRRHLEEIEQQLSELGLTKENYAEFVAQNFNEIHIGTKPFSLLLAVSHNEWPDHVAAIHLFYNKRENFWLVTTVHAIRPDDLRRIPLIWRK